MKLKVLLLAALFAVSNTTSAAIITYFGQDQNPGGVVPANGNASSAQSDFLSKLTGVGIENFDSLPNVGSSGPFSIDFAGSAGNINASLSGTDLDLRNTSSSGTYATSGNQFLRAITNTSATSFTINFSSAIAAFGFFGTDLGDAAGGDLRLTLSNGTTQDLLIDVDPSNNGNLIFFGFVSNSDTFTSVSFSNTAGSGDYWGFDDMIVGDLGQVTDVPAPNTFFLSLFGLLGLASAKRISRKR